LPTGREKKKNERERERERERRKKNLMAISIKLKSLKMFPPLKQIINKEKQYKPHLNSTGRELKIKILAQISQSEPFHFSVPSIN